MCFFLYQNVELISPYTGGWIEIDNIKPLIISVVIPLYTSGWIEIIIIYITIFINKSPTLYGWVD